MEKSFEDVLSNVASQLSNAAEDHFDQVIVGCLREIVTCLGLDRCSIGSFSDQGAKLRVTHTWAVDGVPKVPMDIMVENEAPWLTHQLRCGHIVSVTDASELPASAAREKAYLLSTGLSTVTMIPLLMEEAIVGALGFATFNSNTLLPDSIMPRMRLAAEVISLGIRRHQYAQGLKTLSQTMNAMSVNSGVPMWGRNEHSRELALKLIKIEQKERLRLGDILHEDVMQSLAGATMLIETGSGENENPVVRHAVDALGDALAKLRDLAAILRPDSLDREEISEGLQWLVQTQRASGIQIAVVVDEAVEPLKPEVRLFFYETARKLLDNAATHSHAGKIELEIRRVNGRVRLTVSDDGIGFDPTQVETIPASHQGLFSIRELTNLLGGTMEIHSGHGQMTQVIITIPT